MNKMSLQRKMALTTACKPYLIDFTNLSRNLNDSQNKQSLDNVYEDPGMKVINYD